MRGSRREQKREVEEGGLLHKDLKERGKKRRRTKDGMGVKMRQKRASWENKWGKRKGRRVGKRGAKDGKGKAQRG